MIAGWRYPLALGAGSVLGALPTPPWKRDALVTLGRAAIAKLQAPR